MPSESQSDGPKIGRTIATGGGASVAEAEWLGGPVLVLAANDARAIVALKGAHLLSWSLPALGEQLWLSAVSRLDQDRPPRGGIPICWPWFGPHPDDADQPAHGFARRAPWLLRAATAEAGVARVTLELDPDATKRAQWPFAAEAVLDIALDAGGLSLALTTRNLGTADLPLSQALHTYFRVADIAAVAVDGLDGCDYVDKLDDGRVKRQAGDVTFGAELDRIYFGATASLAVRDRIEGRRTDIASSGSGSAVVWNPWIAKSERLGDMGPDGYRTMACVETANAGPDARRIPAGGQHRLAVRYTVQQIAD